MKTIRTVMICGPLRLMPGWLLLLFVCVLTGCDQGKPDGEATPSTPQSAQPTPKVTSHTYPNLCADPQRKAVLQAYLDAWQQGKSGDDLQAPLDRLLADYSNAHKAFTTSDEQDGYDEKLRLLWDFAGVAHATTIAPDAIKDAVGWQEPKAQDGDAEQVTSIPVDRPLRVVGGSLPGFAARLLESVAADEAGDATFADFVAERVRGIYFSPVLVNWSPSCPLSVCGSSEPLTRTLILVSSGYVDLEPKPSWSHAAVAVHEAAHIEWFHLPEVSKDPRLLLPMPNERNSWRIMARFMTGLLAVTAPDVQPYVAKHGDAIRAMLSRAQEQVKLANQALGLDENDLDLHLDLPEGLSDDALRGAPSQCGVSQDDK